MELSIIILTYNRWEKTKLLLDSLLNYLDRNIKKEIIIIDNKSTDNTINNLKNYDVIVVKNEKNERLKADNIGFKMAKGKYILRLDNDIEFTEPFYNYFIEAINKKNIALVVPLTSSGGKHQKSDSKFDGICDYKFRFGSSVWFFKKSLLEKIGNIDERFSYYCNDVDFQLRILQRGYSIALVGNVLVKHDNISSLSIPENGKEIRKAKEILYQKWGSFIEELYGIKDIEIKETFVEKLIKNINIKNKS